MGDLPGLNVLIGLAFLFFVMATVVSAINELIQTARNSRSRILERGIAALLEKREPPVPAPRGTRRKENSHDVDDFFGEWRVRMLTSPRGRRPSYIPARTFALTVLETATRDSEPRIGTDLYVRARDTVEKVGLPPVEPGKVTLTDRQQKLDATRVELERAFDEVMDRASGWYKRWVQWWVLGLSLVLTAAINADVFRVADHLWRGDGQIPLGWGPDAFEWYSVGGWLVTAAAVSLGAPFWFDLLGKFAQLRGTGNREGTPKSGSAAEDRDDPSGARRS